MNTKKKKKNESNSRVLLQTAKIIINRKLSRFFYVCLICTFFVWKIIRYFFCENCVHKVIRRMLWLNCTLVVRLSMRFPYEQKKKHEQHTENLRVRIANFQLWKYFHYASLICIQWAREDCGCSMLVVLPQIAGNMRSRMFRRWLQCAFLWQDADVKVCTAGGHSVDFAMEYLLKNANCMMEFRALNFCAHRDYDFVFAVPKMKNDEQFNRIDFIHSGESQRAKLPLPKAQSATFIHDYKRQSSLS